jgi:hypothetical protein
MTAIWSGWRAAARAMRWARRQPGITADSLKFGALTDNRWRGNGYDVRIGRSALQGVAQLRISAPSVDVWINAIDTAEALRMLAALQLIPDELTMEVPRQRVCHIAVCDDCGTEYENGDYTPHWPSAVEAADDAANGGDWWNGEGGALLCDNCKLKPHLFLIGEFYTDHCDRCGNPADEHGEVDA